MAMYRLYGVGVAWALLSLDAGAVSVLDDIGFTQLLREVGASLPGGSNVAVAHVEAAVDAGTTPKWAPDEANGEFSGKAFTQKTLPPASLPSSHATGVGRVFYGNASSATPGIANIDVYLADDWLGTGFLNAGAGALPSSTSARVANHSWIGSTDPLAAAGEVLRRVDWLIATDEFIQVGGMGNNATNQPIFGSAFNALAVGRTDARHGQGSVAVDDLYPAGRTRPDLVAPETTTSGATPRAASAAALLVDTAHSDPSLSRGSTTNRNGDTIYNAERSEVIKAALLAGADRRTANGSTAANISDYRLDPANRTANGLDRRYGAGQLNIYNSYRIITAGEQDSWEDGGGSLGSIGFDYDDAFGGQGGSNPEASYFFTTGGAAVFTATLAWNLAVDAGDPPGGVFGGAALYDLDLFLFRYAADAGKGDLIAASTSGNENSENLWTPLDPGQSYLLQVLPGAGQTPFLWDYALAFELTPAAVPVPPAFWLLATGTLMLAACNRRALRSTSHL